MVTRPSCIVSTSVLEVLRCSLSNLDLSYFSSLHVSIAWSLQQWFSSLEVASTAFSSRSVLVFLIALSVEDSQQQEKARRKDDALLHNLSENI